MDIYNILKENSDSIIKEDLDFFEIELATGNYEYEYVNKCLELIKEIRDFKNIKNNKEIIFDVNDPSCESVAITEIPIEELNKIKKEKMISFNDPDYEETIKSMIIKTRSSNTYKNDFIQLIEKYDINELFIDKNYVFFKQIEMDELIKKINFSEDFLEKYFKILNKKLLAEYQLFSEEFYMKHFSQLDYKIVLKKGKNNWITKTNRSSKLTVFLKLKGIVI